MLRRTEIFVAPKFVFNDGKTECVHVSLYYGSGGLTRTLREVGEVGGGWRCKAQVGFVAKREDRGAGHRHQPV